ncbi:MAG: phosphoglycerate dehydrogenase, partial [Lachnospiraceae bacterium]|nr:phosphoglycerate dehydrogenase [Lachnospiraceae bacterium]
RLKVVSRFGVGIDNFDLEAARRHGVTMTNCPGVNATAVGEQFIALLFGLLREVPLYDRHAREGDWSRPYFQELGGKTVSILGFGAVGRQIARKLSGFDVEILAYDKFPDEAAAKALGVRLCSLGEAIRLGDVISVNLPSLPDTYHLINAETIAAMKDGVILVNTARGALVDEGAAAQALLCGKVAGFATDVFESEPVTAANPLFGCPHFLAAPHVATDTAQNFVRIGKVVAEAVTDALAGKTPKNALR